MNGSIIYLFIYLFIIKEDVAQMVMYSKSFLERNEDRYLRSPYFFHCYLSSMFFPLCYMLQFLDIIVTTCFGPAFFLSFLGFRCFRRKVALNGLCERCCCENEDILHALWGCQGGKRNMVGNGAMQNIPIWSFCKFPWFVSRYSTAQVSKICCIVCFYSMEHMV